MNTLKIQQELVKAAFTRDYKNKRAEMLYGVTGDYVVVVPDGYTLYKIPKAFFYLDPETVFEGRKNERIERFLDDSNAMSATDTHASIVETKTGKKRTLHKFILEDGKPAYIDEKFLKCFDLDISTFKAVSPISPLFIYEYGEMVGLVLPVRYVED